MTMCTYTDPTGAPCVLQKGHPYNHVAASDASHRPQTRSREECGAVDGIGRRCVLREDHPLPHFMVNNAGVLARCLSVRADGKWKKAQCGLHPGHSGFHDTELGELATPWRSAPLRPPIYVAYSFTSPEQVTGYDVLVSGLRVTTRSCPAGYIAGLRFGTLKDWLRLAEHQDHCGCQGLPRRCSSCKLIVGHCLIDWARDRNFEQQNVVCKRCERQGNVA